MIIRVADSGLSKKSGTYKYYKVSCAPGVDSNRSVRYELSLWTPLVIQFSSFDEDNESFAGEA